VRLARRGVVADVFVVGGAAMALAYDAARVIRDVDARFVPHGIVVDEAREVAKDLGLPGSTPAEKVAFFGALFAARTDVYAVRWEPPDPGSLGGCQRCAAGGAKGSRPPTGSICC
jgi:hypothetical protein